MKKSRLYLAFSLTLMITCSLGCKKKTATSTPDNPETPAPVTPVVPKPPDTESKKLIPLSITAENLKIDLTYAENKNILTEIRQSNGTRELIVYDAKNQPKQYKRYLKDDLRYQIDYIVNDEGLVTKAIQYNLTAGGKLLTPIGAYEIGYKTSKQIERVDWYDHKNMIQHSKTYSYNDKQLLTSVAIVIPQGNTQTYEYDDKPGVFDQIPFLNVISLENDAFFLKNVKANLQHISNDGQPAEALTFELQYNTAGYPSVIKQTTASGKSSTYKITYQ